jgi:hypothetical protein
MRSAISLLLLLHGLAHLVGFRAAFWPSAVAPGQLTRKLGRFEGVAWLLLALGFAATACLLWIGRSEWLGLLIWSAGTSLALCCVAWPDARVGLLLDLVLLGAGVALMSQGEASLASAFADEIRQLPQPASAKDDQKNIDEAAIAALPEPARRYLRFMGVVGRPRDSSLRARFEASFRRDAGAWLPCTVLQYDTRAPVSRVFMMQLALDGVLPVTVRDAYVRGRGTMEARAFDRFRVAEARGYELDVGELVTYLNDAVLMAPSLVLGPETTWSLVDSNSFQVALRDGSLTVSALVTVDGRGAPTLFATSDRFFDDPNGQRVRTEWRTPIAGWQTTPTGRKLPTRAQAVWQLPSGPLVYADFTFDPAQIAFNVPPG